MAIVWIATGIYFSVRLHRKLQASIALTFEAESDKRDAEQLAMVQRTILAQARMLVIASVTVFTVTALYIAYSVRTIPFPAAFVFVVYPARRKISQVCGVLQHAGVWTFGQADNHIPDSHIRAGPLRHPLRDLSPAT